MRDMKLLYTEGVGFDIDIEDGFAVEVNEDSQTNDQRAAIGAVFVKGTLPADTSFGVSWDALYDQQATLMDISNEVQTTIQSVAGSGVGGIDNYYPMFIPHEQGSVKVTVLRGTVR